MKRLISLDMVRGLAMLYMIVGHMLTWWPVPEENWIQTKPGVGFFVYLRLYGPLESYFDKTWRPGDPKLVK